jgi:hypothetical protein
MRQKRKKIYPGFRRISSSQPHLGPGANAPQAEEEGLLGFRRIFASHS